MFATIWSELFTKPIFNLLIFIDFYVGNFGIAIILLTLVLKTLLLPANIPNIKMLAKKKDLDVELQEIKDKYTDKTVVAQKQMELYKKHGLNPMAGCLPNILQFMILIALYNVFVNTLSNSVSDGLYYFTSLSSNKLDLNFIYLNLGNPDPYYVLPVLAGLSQFFMSKLLMPTVKKGEQIAKKTPNELDDIMYSMQQQMLYIAPIMTVFIGATLPSGLALYWFVSSLYSAVQTFLLKRLYIK